MHSTLTVSENACQRHPTKQASIQPHYVVKSLHRGKMQGCIRGASKKMRQCAYHVVGFDLARCVKCSHQGGLSEVTTAIQRSDRELTFI